MSEITEIVNKSIKSKLPLHEQSLRVAAYCRVSTTYEEQKSSLSAQIAYYKLLIETNPNWTMVDIYAEAVTGVDIKRRPRFRQMLEDCRRKRIDLIITKSVSRFGRNTLDTLRTIDELTSLNIGVLFEQENIFTINTDGRIFLTLLSCIAQDESESKSKNIKWGMQHSFESGQSKFINTVCFGYEKDENGKLIIKDSEARTVRLIFQLYLDGYSLISISRVLKEKGIPSPTGRPVWGQQSLSNLLCNEKYVGDVMLQKTFSVDIFNNKRIMNEGQVGRYLVSNSHEGIIDRDTFEKLQEEKVLRSNVVLDKRGRKKRKSTRFTGI